MRPSLILHIKVCLTGVGECYCVRENKLYKAFCSSRGKCVWSDKLPRVTSRDSVGGGYELETEKKKNLG